ncbi:MAG: 2-oxoacid:acceptor oxidoreductase family protein, partial [Chloroflexi bacterium]|nr:2-oxoacid:acceptor oxidoreductase family protein [Chloroflexota bacterium]
MASRREVRISGFGGQGIVLAGVILARAAAIYNNAEATQTNSHGAESRGGACVSD